MRENHAYLRGAGWRVAKHRTSNIQHRMAAEAAKPCKAKAEERVQNAEMPVKATQNPTLAKAESRKQEKGGNRVMESLAERAADLAEPASLRHVQTTFARLRDV